MVIGTVVGGGASSSSSSCWVMLLLLGLGWHITALMHQVHCYGHVSLLPRWYVARSGTVRHRWHSVFQLLLQYDCGCRARRYPSSISECLHRSSVESRSVTFHQVLLSNICFSREILTQLQYNECEPVCRAPYRDKEVIIAIFILNLVSNEYISESIKNSTLVNMNFFTQNQRY